MSGHCARVELLVHIEVLSLSSRPPFSVLVNNDAAVVHCKNDEHRSKLGMHTLAYSIYNGATGLNRHETLTLH